MNSDGTIVLISGQVPASVINDASRQGILVRLVGDTTVIGDVAFDARLLFSDGYTFRVSGTADITGVDPRRFFSISSNIPESDKPLERKHPRRGPPLPVIPKARRK